MNSSLGAEKLEERIASPSIGLAETVQDRGRKIEFRENFDDAMSQLDDDEVMLVMSSLRCHHIASVVERDDYARLLADQSHVTGLFAVSREVLIEDSRVKVSGPAWQKPLPLSKTPFFYLKNIALLLCGVINTFGILLAISQSSHKTWMLKISSLPLVVIAKVGADLSHAYAILLGKGLAFLLLFLFFSFIHKKIEKCAQKWPEEEEQ